MKILVQNIGIAPYTSNLRKVISVGGKPKGDIATKIYVKEVVVYPSFANKLELYWKEDTQELMKWSETEQLENYKLAVKLDMEHKTIEYVGRLDYRLYYYQLLLDNGDTLTPGQITDRTDKRTARITASAWVHNRAVAIDTATTKMAVDTEYNNFKAQYKKKNKQLENVL